MSIRSTLLDALMQHQDDSLERAKIAFRGMTPEQMNQQHGQSGMTRQEILDGYQARRDKVEAARRWVEENAT